MLQRRILRVSCKVHKQEAGIFSDPQWRGFQLRVEGLGGIRNFRSIIQIKDVGCPQFARLK